MLESGLVPDMPLQALAEFDGIHALATRTEESARDLVQSLQVPDVLRYSSVGSRRMEGTPIMVLPMIIGGLLHSSSVSLPIQMHAHPIGTVPPDRQLGKSPALHSVNIVWRLPA